MYLIFKNIYFTKLIFDLDFWTWIFVYFELDFCSYTGSKNHVRKRQKIKLQNQFLDIEIDRGSDDQNFYCATMQCNGKKAHVLVENLRTIVLLYENTNCYGNWHSTTNSTNHKTTLEFQQFSYFVIGWNMYVSSWWSTKSPQSRNSRL